MLLYGWFTAARNWLYDKDILKSAEFEIPTIVVGNLAVGGTGKSPHIEYLIQLLKDTVQVATLSRGYGRKTTGFILADEKSDAKKIGDEPLLYKLKHPEMPVAVAESRVMAIPKLLHDNPATQVILLDDAFQHRSLRPGLKIILTTYQNLFTRDSLLPIGDLREDAKNYKRADIIVVTKCPPDLSKEEKEKITREINPFPYQHLYFSTVKYGTIYKLFAANLEELYYPNILTKDKAVLMVTGIANHTPFVDFVKSYSQNVFTFPYRDHHQFDEYDLEQIRETFLHLSFDEKIILTTEKDAVRLIPHRNWFLQNKIEIFVQPIVVDFLGEDKQKFDNDILFYISKITEENDRQFIAEN